eukprot:s1632_g11.t2
MSDKVLSMEEVAKHNTKEDCWVVLYGKAYDLTKFAKVHPGGAKLITDAAGMDATKIFDPIHPKDIMDKLLKPALTMGVVDAATIKPEHVAKPPEAHKPAPKKKKKAVTDEAQQLLTLFILFARGEASASSLQNALNDGGSVEGCVRGLECDGIPRPATSVEILSNTQGFGTGDYIKGAKPNTWTLDENCEVVAFNFFSIGALPSVHKSTLFFNSAEDQGASFRAGVASGLNVRTGSIDVSMVDVDLKFEQAEEEVEEFKKPPLNAMLNSFDFESVAREVMEPQAWGYYSSGGDDEITLRDNHLAFQRITMRPRILVNVREIDMTTHILGVPASVPLYFTATALAKLAHQDGEVAIVKAAKKAGVPYMLPTLSSYTLDEMLAARTPDQQVFSQLYVNPERSRSEEYVKKLEDAGVKALFVTVDAPQLGRREKDMRNKFTQQGSDVQGDDEEDGAVDRSQGATRAISSYIDPGLNWEDVPWLKSITKMKVLLKGVQCAEDAVSAYKAGLSGCVLSNHGGRQLDTCRPGIEVLPEVMEGLREAGATKENFAVFIDGGVRRGGDIFKAVALGAQAVGVGRPVLYSLASYGMNGIVRMVHMLQDELQMVMRLSGTPNIPSITEKHVIITNLADHIVPLPTDFLVQRTYQGLEPAAKL